MTTPPAPMPPPGLCVYPDVGDGKKWRIHFDEEREEIVVQYSVDGGKTWHRDYTPHSFEASSILMRIWLDIEKHRRAAWVKLNHLVQAEVRKGVKPRGPLFWKARQARTRMKGKTRWAQQNAETCRKMGVSGG